MAPIETEVTLDDGRVKITFTVETPVTGIRSGEVYLTPAEAMQLGTKLIWQGLGAAVVDFAAAMEPKLQ